jgi:hypothetical protein
LTNPFARRCRTLTWREIGGALQTEAEAAIELMASRRGWKPTVRAKYDFEMRAAISLARCTVGVRVQTLNELTRPDIVEKICLWLVAQKTYLWRPLQVARMLKNFRLSAVAMRSGEERELAAICRSVRPKQRRRTTSVLRALSFKDTEVLGALLRLPLELVRTAGETASFGAASRAQIAAALAILFSAPMRRSKLSIIRLDDLEIHPGNGAARLTIPGPRGNSITVHLSTMASAVCRAYLHRFRVYFTNRLGEDRGFLFPGKIAGHVAPASLVQKTCALTEKHLAVRVHPELLRDVGLLHYLTQNPGDYETVRQTFGYGQIRSVLVRAQTLGVAGRGYAQVGDLKPNK